MALPITYIPLTKIRDEIPHICICRDLHGVIKAQSFLETHLRQDTITLYFLKKDSTLITAEFLIKVFTWI